MKADRFLQRAVHLTISLGITSVLNVSAAADFTDANWISLGGIPGANSQVYAAVMDGSGNLYIGGGFTLVGDVIANRIAKWNGSSWSALGSGLNCRVAALAGSGSDVDAGGDFTTAGGSAANHPA